MDGWVDMKMVFFRRMGSLRPMPMPTPMTNVRRYHLASHSLAFLKLEFDLSLANVLELSALWLLSAL